MHIKKNKSKNYYIIISNPSNKSYFKILQWYQGISKVYYSKKKLQRTTFEDFKKEQKKKRDIIYDIIYDTIYDFKSYIKRCYSSIISKKEGWLIFNILIFVQNSTLLCFTCLCNNPILSESGIEYPVFLYTFFFLVLNFIILLLLYIIEHIYLDHFFKILITLSNILLFFFFYISFIYIFYIEWNFDIYTNNELLCLKIPLLDCYIHKLQYLLTDQEKLDLIRYRLSWNKNIDMWNWFITDRYHVKYDIWNEWLKFNSVNEIWNAVDNHCEKLRNMMVNNNEHKNEPEKDYTGLYMIILCSPLTFLVIREEGYFIYEFLTVLLGTVP